MPPTPDEVDAFLGDKYPQAYERLVDRLLATPRFGERMAMHWLDVARFADTDGYEEDHPRSMWLWRDWVIDAFNRNMTFDQFTIEQLAGDLLPRATIAQRVATGFNRNHRINREAGTISEEWRVENVIDRVNTTATVWLGLTMICARCHDRKYDPIAQREFYRLFAYFNNVPEVGNGGSQTKGNAVPILAVPTAENQRTIDELDERLEAARSAVEKLEPQLLAELSEWEKTVEVGMRGEELNFAGDDVGTLVTVLDTLVERETENYILEIGDTATTGFLATHTCANNCFDKGLGGLAMQAANGPLPNTYFAGAKSVVDGGLHTAMISSDGSQ